MPLKLPKFTKSRRGSDADRPKHIEVQDGRYLLGKGDEPDTGMPLLEGMKNDRTVADGELPVRERHARGIKDNVRHTSSLGRR